MTYHKGRYEASIDASLNPPLLANQNVMDDPTNFLSITTLPTISWDGKPSGKRRGQKVTPLTYRLSDVEIVLDAARKQIQNLQHEQAAIEGFAFAKGYNRTRSR